MKHISELAYRYRIVFWFMILTILFGGIYSFMNISKLEDPEIVVMQAMVVTIYPGASAEEVEMHVSNVIENEIRSIDGIEQISSTSISNVSQISVLLKFSVPEKEITQKWDILRRKVQAAQAKLPSGVQPSMVLDDIGDVYGIFYAMTGDGYSYEELNRYANFIKREMLMLEGVKRVDIFGNQPSCINIELLPEKVAALGIYPTQVALAINSHSQPVYAGSINKDNQTFPIEVSGQFKSIDDIANLPIRGFENDIIRLQDIANVEKGITEPERFTMLYDGETALGIFIAMEGDQNVVEVGNHVTKRMDELTPQIPLGIEFQKVFFQPEKVSNAISNFMWNLIMSVLVVVIVLMFTMGFRSGIIIGIGLLLTILASFPILQMTGGTLQRISLGAFIVAMGMLVDNAIVVMDGITVDLQNKLPIKVALFRTAKKNAIPLLGATAIAIVCFLPVYLSPDTAGVYIGDLFIVLCISLGLSWVLALTQVPIFSIYLLDFKKYRNNTKKLFSGRLYKYLTAILNFLMRHKISTLVVATLLLALSIFGFRYTKQTFFPDFDYDQAYIELTLPPNTSLEVTNEIMKKASKELLQIEGIRHVTASQGMTPGRYCLVRAVNQVGDNYAEFILDFDNFKTMQKLRGEIERYFFENYPDAYSRFRLYNLSILSTHTVEVQFSGPDINVLRDLEQQAEVIMRGCDLINQRTVCSDMAVPSKYISAQYSEIIGSQLGTSRSDVSMALLAATDGIPLGTYWEGINSYPINLKIRDKEGKRIEDLKQIPVWNIIPNFNAVDGELLSDIVVGSTTTGQAMRDIIAPIPLEQVVDDMPLKWEEGVIHKTDGRRIIQAQCDPIREASPSDVKNKIQKQIEAIELPEGYDMQWVGEYNLQNKALKNIIALLPVAAILVLLILILLFNNVRKTSIILLCLPFVAIGIVPGLILFEQPYSFVAIVGTIGMAGMMIKNGIVLIEEIDSRIGSGEERYNAIINATLSRMRPVMMASMTTILGMIPLLPDPMYGALAVTIMCGLLIGTCITLILLPILYALFFKIHKPKTIAQ